MILLFLLSMIALAIGSIIVFGIKIGIGVLVAVIIAIIIVFTNRSKGKTA